MTTTEKRITINQINRVIGILEKSYLSRSIYSFQYKEHIHNYHLCLLASELKLNYFKKALQTHKEVLCSNSGAYFLHDYSTNSLPRNRITKIFLLEFLKQLI